MTEVLYPVGYATARVTMTELQRRYAGGMEPEYARRLFAWLKSQNGKFGIGGGWRPNPSNVSLASQQGKSFHQTQTFNDGTKWFCAVDLVVYNPGGVHRAPTRAEAVWQGSDAAKKAGVHCNIDSETWHMQPVEIDGYDSWVTGGRVRPKPNYPITGAIPVTGPTTLPGFPPFSPSQGQFSLWPLAIDKPILKLGMPGQPTDAIRYFQGVMAVRAKYVIAVDGFYGNQSVAACKAFQGWNNLPQTGIVDAATWKAIDALALR